MEVDSEKGCVGLSMGICEPFVGSIHAVSGQQASCWVPPSGGVPPCWRHQSSLGIPLFLLLMIFLLLMPHAHAQNTSTLAEFIKNVAIQSEICSEETLWPLSNKLGNKTILVGFLPLQTYLTPPSSIVLLLGMRIPGAFSWAVDTVNNGSFLPDGYKMQFEVYDTKGSEVISTKHVTDLLRRKASAIFGPESTCQMEGTVAADYNRVMMSYACSNEILNDKNEYKSFAKINPSASSLISATIEVLKQNNWNKFSILYDVNYITIVEQLVAAATKDNMTINHKEKFIWMQCNAFFQDTKASTRIYVYVGHRSNVNKLLLTMAMTGIYLPAIKGANKAQKYMLIYMDNEGGYEPKNWRDYIWNSRQRSYYTQFDFEYDLMNYYKGFMIVANRFRDEGQLKSFTEKVNEYNIKEPFCLSAGPIQRDVPYLSAAYLYDSVILYANVVREIYNSMAEGNVMDAASNGSAIVSKLRNKTYESILGYNMTLDQNAQSQGEYSVYLLDDCPLDLKERLNETCSKCLVKIGDYEPEDDIPLSLEVDLKYILDEPTCGYVNPTCQTEEFGELRTYVSFYLGVCLVFFLFTSIILYWKRRLIQKNCWGIQKK